MARADISLKAFAFMEYDRRGWDMPDVHVRIYDWLERTDGVRNRVLRVFRGVGKSTALGVRNAWKFRQVPGHQMLVQGADDVDLPDVGSIEGHVAGPGAAEIGGPVPAGVRAIRSDNVVICWIDCAVGYHYLVGVEEHSDAPWISYGRWADPALDHRTYVFRQPF